MAVIFFFLMKNIFLFCSSFKIGNQALTDFTEQACYGNGFEDYLIPSCQGGEKIFIHNVFVYAKRKELNCPQIATYFDRNITFCCNYVSEKEDCGQRYFGTSSDFEHAHYSRCTGQATCAGIPVAWNYTEHFCDVTFFEERTNYMKMWYNCIPGLNIFISFFSPPVKLFTFHTRSNLCKNKLTTFWKELVFLISHWI